MYDACVPWPERPKGAKDKSRGPKGLELEVGARRAPKLLVSNNIFQKNFQMPNFQFEKKTLWLQIFLEEKHGSIVPTWMDILLSIEYNILECNILYFK